MALLGAKSAESQPLRSRIPLVLLHGSLGSGKCGAASLSPLPDDRSGGRRKGVSAGNRVA